MKLISLAAAITITEWSERTFWRRFADGSLTRENEQGRSMIPLDLIRPHMCIPLDSEDLPVLAGADAGNAEAQNDLALIFLANRKPKGAVYWLELAAKQEYASAMNWLGRCYIEGNGVPKDENLGIMWISKAAAHGDKISQGQMQAILDRFPRDANI